MKKDREELQTTSKLLHRVKEIYDIMRESNVSEIDLNIEEYNIKIKRFTMNSDSNIDVINTKQPLLSYATKEDKESVKAQEVIGEEIISPINGIFYRSPSPGAPPLVNEGDIVSAGSDLCIIEAMKVMNKIKAEKKCKIIKVLCENGTSVSVGTPLFLVEPL